MNADGGQDIVYAFSTASSPRQLYSAETVRWMVS
jgi:hypothetical protein